MYLGNNVLNGTIPTELGALHKLSTLDVGKRHTAIKCYEYEDGFIRQYSCIH